LGKAFIPEKYLTSKNLRNQQVGSADILPNATNPAKRGNDRKKVGQKNFYASSLLDSEHFFDNTMPVFLSFIFLPFYQQKIFA